LSSAHERTYRKFVDFDTCTGSSSKAKAAKAFGKSAKAKNPKSKEGGVDAKADKIST